MKRYAVALLGVLFAGGAIAAEPKSEETEADKLVCKTEKVTGSRTKVRRECLTQAQWDQLAQELRKRLDEGTAQASQRQVTIGQQPQL